MNDNVRQKMVIVGAGMGGCVLASTLHAHYDVTVVEMDEGPEFPLAIKDVGVPLNNSPVVASGLGGSTRFWHNGLIEIGDAALAEWPVNKAALATFVARAWRLLGGLERAEVEGGVRRLRRLFSDRGIAPEMTGQALYYPARRRNLWQLLCRGKPIELVYGRAAGLRQEGGKVVAVEVIDAAGAKQDVQGDIFVLCAGGLGTPLLLQTLPEPEDGGGTALAGCFYEDHPMAFVGEVQLGGGLYRLWNYPAAGGTLRLPLATALDDGTPLTFFLRPAAHWWRMQRRAAITSVLNELRNRPWRVRNYLALLGRWDDVLDILSLKLGIRVPTDRYTLLMVAGQKPLPHKAVWGENEAIVRDWRLEDGFFEDVEAALKDLMAGLGPVVKDFRLFEDWRGRVMSSGHHSGTARMADGPAHGVCDGDGRVFGYGNLYVGDASAIPDSGASNTGLTITALALRLAGHLKRQCVAGPMRIVVSGAGGFIGKGLVEVLRARGHEVVDAHDFAAGENADGFVNLANIAGNAAGALALLESNMRLAVGARVFVQAQSFITLHGKGGPDARAFNMGFCPRVLDAYGVGKLLQERHLERAVARGELTGVACLYLPIVLGEGGAWARALAQAEAHGYVLPRHGAEARALFVTIEDIADAVEAAVAAGLRGVVRQVVVNPDSAAMTWERLLGAKKLGLPRGAGLVKHLLRAAVAEARGRKLAWMWRLGRIQAVPAAEIPAKVAGGGAAAQGPLHFYGVMARVVRTGLF